jgi:S1-C subfamily serine protease
MAALGSGFVIDKRGDILTSDCVVQGNTNGRAVRADRRSAPSPRGGREPPRQSIHRRIAHDAAAA